MSPRLLPRREGLWVIRSERSQLHGWRVLALFLALPALTLAGVTLAVARQSWAYAVFLDAPGEEAPRREAAAAWSELNRAALSNLVHLEPPRERSEVPTVRLEVGKRALELMQESILRGDPALGHEPGGHKPYVSGLYRDDDGPPIECKVAYRGLTPPHHYAAKPSLRVRLKKAQVRAGRRYVELQRPEDALGVINWLPEQLAQTQGLLTSQSDLVRLFVNRRYLGVYVRSYRPGEPLALAQDRLPGVFFKGDALSPEHAVSLPLFKGEGWRTFPEALDGDPRAARAPLERLLDAVDRGQPAPFDAARRRRLGEVLDVEAYARFVALLALVGSAHVDAVHNHVLFWNTNRGLLEPVVWDLNGYQDSPELPVDLVQHPIVERLSRDPTWVHRRNLALHRLRSGPGSADAQIQRLDALALRLGPDLRADPNLAALTPSVTGFARLRAVPVAALDEELERLRGWVRARDAFLRGYLSLARVHVAPHPQRAGASRVQVAGAVAVEVRWPGGRALLHAAHSLGLYQRDPKAPAFMLPVARSYDVEAPPSALTFRNGVTGGPVALAAAAMQEGPSRSLRPEDLPVDAGAPVILGPGEVVLSEDLHVGPGQSLEVRPGTTLRLAPGIGIYARGPVRFLGAAEAPIRLERAGEGPWACVGLRGEATAGSRFEHVRAQGGSVGSDRSGPFLGMLSVYGCPELTLVGCTFRANVRGDDATNLARSKVHIEDCEWSDAPADGLDLDACSGTVQRARFLRCGNDGLDTSTSHLVLDDCAASACGDKGLSVGEASRVLARRLTVTGCKLGVEVKDGSALLLEGARLTGNGVGLHLYQKKWAFNVGGVAALVDCLLGESRIKDLCVERRCAVFTTRSEVQRPGFGAERVRAGEALPEPWQALRRALLER